MKNEAKERNDILYAAKITFLSIWWFCAIIFGDAGFMLWIDGTSNSILVLLVASAMYIGAVLVVKRERKKQMGLD